MQLYFTCPVTGKVFSSEHYVLVKNYDIVQTGNKEKELIGMVDLQEVCPLCGGQHRFKVKDVICPLTGGLHDK